MSDPMTLVEFLLARLDEDDAGARAAIRRHGHWLQGFGPEADASQVYEVTQEELDHADGCEGNHPIGSPNPCEFNVLIEPGAALDALPVMDDVAAHVARHDPARVLAEVEAKRRIVDLHKPQDDWSIGPDDIEYLTGHACVVDDDPYPCETLELLALPYADHEDYREEWKP